MKSLAAIRVLFIYIDLHPDPGNSNGKNRKELEKKIRKLVVAVGIDSVNYKLVKAEETLPLSVKKLGAEVAYVDKNSRLLLHYIQELD